MTQLFDPGLQPERTSLAWMRSSLALVIGSALVMRISLPGTGLFGFIAGSIGLALALAASITAGARYKGSVGALQSDGRLQTDGKIIALSCASAVTIGIIAAGFVLEGI